MISLMPRKKKPPHLRRLPGRPALYNWDKIFDGNRRVFEQGIDFRCSTASFRTQLYQNARERNIKIETKLHGSSIAVQALVGVKPTDGRQKYDWDLLLDGQTHYLQLGRDIHVALESFRAHAYTVAKNRGQRVTTRSVNNLVLLRAISVEVPVAPVESEPPTAATPAIDEDEFLSSLMYGDPS